MAKSRNEEEISLIETGWGVFGVIIHWLVKLANEMKLPAGALYRLGTEDGEETLKLALGAFLAEVAKSAPPVAEEPHPPAPPPLLVHYSNFAVNSVSRFVPSEKIKLGTDSETGVKTVYVDPNLETLMQGLVEENISPANLRIDRLSRYTNSSEISEALVDRFAFFSDLWELVKLQPRGEAGTLHTDGKANLIKVKINGVVWLVVAIFDCWYDEEGWRFYACQADSSDGWVEGRQVISRDSLVL